MDIVTTPNDFFEKSDRSSSSAESNSKSNSKSNTQDTPNRMKDGDFASSVNTALNIDKPKLSLNDGAKTTKFKRNKVNRIESDLKVSGHRKTDIDRRMLLEMKE